MRKALIGILIAATAATPALAQDGNWRGRSERGGERNAARAERVEQRSQERQERVEQREEARPQAVRQERQQRQAEQQQVQAQQQVQIQQQVQVRQQQAEGQRSWRGNSGGNSGGNWQGRDRGAERQALEAQFQATREASRRSAEGSPASYQRQAQRNEQRYEQQTREQAFGRDRNRGDRGNRGSWNGDRGSWNGDRGTRDNRSAYRGDWNRTWRNDNRYDWQRYRYSNRNLFHSGRYYSPYRDYSYNRLSIGLFLDSLFYSQNYWIGDPWQYRLPAAPYGTQWVRYYDDVVLVDVYTGEVIDVIYDFFW
ncbi:MAG TPA: RcnB family protein [Allosphingosinicella sp.]|jgi:hypothetical protein